MRHAGQHQCAAAEHDAIVITPSDVRYDAMAPEDMIVVGYNGTVLETGGRDASWPRTAAAPDAVAIVHTESTFVNVLGALGRTIDPVLLNMVLYAKNPVPIMPFAFSTNAAFGERSAEIMGDNVNAVVWANRGLMAIGTSLRLALKVAVAVEENAEVLYHARARRKAERAPVRLPRCARGCTSFLSWSPDRATT